MRRSAPERSSVGLAGPPWTIFRCLEAVTTLVRDEPPAFHEGLVELHQI